MSMTPDPHDVVSLRGPEAQRIGGRFWFVVGVLVSIVIAVFIVVSFIAAVNDNARAQRLKADGLAVTVTVTNCTGNIGGSGSNAAGYTCSGEYRVHGIRYREVIGSKTSFSATGTTLRGVADPKNPSTIELASAVAASSTSNSVYVIPGVLAAVFIALALVIARVRRSSRAAESLEATDPKG
jgi:hypothetical protein